MPDWPGRSVSGIGDAERLPFPNDSFDAVVCECAFCTFPDKPRAAAELARVLRPGGRVGINDVTVEPDQLQPELQTLAGWVACLDDAQPLDTYAAILADAGLTVTCTERHDSALAVAIDAIDAQLRTLQLLARSTSAHAHVDFDRALNMTALANHAVDQGIAGYGLLIAQQPAQNMAERRETYR